ncbi:MAG: DUF177 domain-containing protein [Eggerthellaceae bacterium]|nr:DUF177 domain-containing protein [Eggerthellaceae bacterium]
MDHTTIHVPTELFAPAESSSYAGRYAVESLSAGPDTYLFAEPLQWNVTVSNTGGALLVAGVVTGTGTTECARCLEPMDVRISGDIEGYYLLDAEEAQEEEGAEEEFDVLGPDNTIDLIPLIEAAILVDVPLQPLCKDDCAGICPDCGANLNEASCGCAAVRKEFEAARNPFSVLKDLKL